MADGARAYRRASSDRIVNANRIKPFKIAGAGDIRPHKRIHEKFQEEELENNENIPPWAKGQQLGSRTSSSAGSNTTRATSLKIDRTALKRQIPGLTRKAAGEMVPGKAPPATKRASSAATITTPPTPKVKPPKLIAGATKSSAARASIAQATRATLTKVAAVAAAARTPPRPIPKRSVSKLLSPKKPFPSTRLPQVLENLENKASSSAPPTTPTPKARKLQEWSHEHAKKGYTPKMRDPRPPTVDWKDQKSPSKRISDLDWDMPADSVHTLEDELIQARKLKLIPSAISPIPIPHLGQRFPITELEMIELKDTLYSIAGGDIFCITIGDLAQLPDLVVMPGLCLRILEEYDFTDPANFAFKKDRDRGSLLCNVVNKFLSGDHSDEFKVVRESWKVTDADRMRKDTLQLVQHFNDEIGLQRSNIKNLSDNLEEIMKAKERCERDIESANQELQKLIGLHRSAYSLHLVKLREAAVEQLYPPFRTIVAQSSGESKSGTSGVGLNDSELQQ